MAKFCPECGFKQHNDNNRYCSNCGFDFSKVESNIKSEESDNSSITVPITSDDEVVSKPAKSTDSKTIGSSSSVSSSDSGVISSSSSVSSTGSSAKSSSTSSAKTTKTYTSKSSNNGFLSNLSFNKCFLAFAVLMIILVILGMIAQTDKEPYSDDGLTSFMERSSSYGLSDFIEDSNNYYDDYDSDYLSYGGHDDSSYFIDN
ncbi:hypothetical protein [Methanobrevibacter sp.]|uniref:hypothetical protein n=1 Tax=Methanobrevibacter sp. TaxID=66852 RepID=UPI0038663A46